MTSAFGDLNGSGNQQLWIDVYRTVASGNGYYYRAIGRYYGNGWGSYNNDVDQYWSANLGGYAISGSWRLYYANRYDTYTTLFDVTFYRATNSAGYGTGFTSTFSIDTSHSSVGDGSVSVIEAAPPRITQAPGAPGTPVLTDALPTSIDAAWTAPADNGGASITNYQVQVATDSGFSSVVKTVNAGASLSTTITDLTPGIEYWVRVRATNSVGYGSYSSSASEETLAGGRVWDGSAWRNCKVWAWDGSQWRLCRVRAWDGSAWRNTR